MKRLPSLCLILLACASTVQAVSKPKPAPAPPAPSCDRECLRGMLTEYLYALVRHDTSKLPLSDSVRITEDAIEKPLAKVGLVNTVTRLRGYRQDFLDERGGMATTASVVEESGAPI